MGLDRNLTSSKKKAARRRNKKVSKVVENPKSTLIIHTNKIPKKIKVALSELHVLKKPLAVKLGKKNKINPFSDITSVEFFSNKNDSSLFVVGTSTKKHPNGLVFGRTFDYKLLDMVEFSLEDYKEIVKNVKLTNAYGSKPCLLFQGDEFINSPKHKVIKNLLIDLFRGEEVKKISITGLDHVYVFTSFKEDLIYFKHYLIEMLKPNSKGCQIRLKEIGPSMKLKIKRTRFASDDLKRIACRKPQILIKSKKRNKSVTVNKLGEKIGRVHIKQQDISQIALRKFKKKRKRN